MQYKGRRLKRFLGLRRKKGYHYDYSVENILPNKIIGWAASRDLKLNEVQLFAGDNLIAKTKLNIVREDVSKSLNIDGKHGFILNLPDKIPKINNNLNIKLIITTNKKEIKLIIKKNIYNYDGSFSDYLHSLLKSDFLSAEGHFDGVSHDNLLIGWAAKSSSSNSLSIWIQCNDLDPIKLNCDNYRNDNGLNLVTNYYGFEIYIYDLPKEWQGKSVFCSFDKDGLFKLPQDKKIYIKPNAKEPKVSIIKKGKNINNHVES